MPDLVAEGSDPASDLLVALELHSPERIAAALDAGVDAVRPLRGKSPMQWLLEMYTRSPRFPACVRLLLSRGGLCPDPLVLPVLIDDPVRLGELMRREPGALGHRANLTCAYTPLRGATLLHVAAEYGALHAAQALIDSGADVNATALIDAEGFGGHTPIFHTVNVQNDLGAPMRRLLLDHGARTDVRAAGIRWGEGFDWETAIFDVTPISYAQMGMLPQMHRDEATIALTVAELLGARGGAVPQQRNIPNRYLQPRRSSARS